MENRARRKKAAVVPPVIIPGLEKIASRMMNAAPVTFLVYQASGQCVYANQAAAHTVGTTEDVLLTQNFRLLESWKKSGMLDSAARALASGRECRGDFHFVSTFGREVWLDAIFFSFIAEGSTYLLVVANDISERKQVEQALRESEKKYRQLIELSQEGIWTINVAGNITFVNQRMADMLGYQVEEMLGKHLFDFMEGETIESAKKNLERRRQGIREQQDFEFVRRDGGHIYTMIDSSPIYDERGNYAGTLGLVADITVRKQWEEELQALTLTDELTGLYNRRGFMTVAQQELNVARRLKKKVSLLFVDVDNMKWINDHLGHREGDMALIDAATVLSDTLRESDIVARISGDEFVVFALETEEMNDLSLLGRLKEGLAAWNAKTKRRYELSVSIGASCFDPAQPVSLDDLLDEADRKMYENKRTKRKPAPKRAVD